MDSAVLKHLDLAAVSRLSADTFIEAVPADIHEWEKPFPERTIPLSAFAAVLGEGMTYDPVGSDAWLAPRIHAALRLYRSEAAQPEIWIYLATQYPEYIRWRWGRSGSINQRRISGPLHRQAFARLWWIAELTRNGSDYQPVANAYRDQDTAQWLLEIDAFHNRAAALAFAEYVSSSKSVRNGAPEIATRFNHALTVVPLDAIAPDPGPYCGRLAEWITAVPDETLMYGDRLPAGPEDRKVPREHIESIVKLIERLDND